MKTLKEYKAERDVQHICLEQGIHQSRFYNQKKKYSCMDANQLSEFRMLKEEKRPFEEDVC